MSDSATEIRIVHGTIVLLASRLLKLLAAWLVEITLVRMLSPEVWNSVSRLMTFSLGVVLLGQFGFPESVLNFSSRAEDNEQAKRVLYRAMTALWLMALVLCVVALPFPGTRETLLGDASLSVLLWFGLFVAAELTQAPIPSFLVGRKFVRPAGIYGVAGRVPSVLGALAALAIDRSLTTVIAGMAVGSFLSTLMGVVLVQRLVPTPSRPSTELGLRNQVTFAAPVGLSRVTQVLNAQLDKYVVMGLMPDSPYGTYYLGATEFPFVSALGQTATSVMVPDLAEAARVDKPRFVRLFHGATAKISLVSLPILVFLEVFAERIFSSVYGAEYTSAAGPFRVFQLLLLVRFTSFALMLQTLGKAKVPFYAAAIMMAFNAPLSFLFTKLFGLIGPSLATVTSNYLSTYYTFRELKNAMQVSWSNLLPWRSYFSTLLVSMVTIVPTYFALRSAPLTVPWLVAAALLYLVTYVAAIRTFGLLDRHSLTILRQAVRGRG